MNQTIHKTAATLVLGAAALMTTGCASLQDSTTRTLGTTTGGAVVGAGFGAGLGVGIAALASTNPWTGAIVGAGVGLLAGTLGGYAAGDNMAKCEAQGGKTTWQPSY